MVVSGLTTIRELGITVTMTDIIDSLPLDVHQVTEHYATMTLVLAGFVFASAIVLLSNPPRDKNPLELSTSLFSLLTVFFIFLIASFMYSTIPGHKEDDRILVLFFVSCSLFSLGAVHMFVSLIWLFIDYGVSNAIVSGIRLMIHGIILIASFNMFWVCALVVEGLEKKIWHSDWTTVYWAIPILILPLLPMCFRVLRISDKKTDVRNFNVYRCLLISSLLFTILSGIYFGISGLSDLFYYPFWGKYLIMVGLGVLFFGAEAILPQGSIWSDFKNVLSTEKH